MGVLPNIELALEKFSNPSLWVKTDRSLQSFVVAPNECRVVNKIQRCNSISLTMSLWSMLFDPHCTTYRSNIRVLIKRNQINVNLVLPWA